MGTPGGDLIRAMAAGDRDAFARFYDRYAPFVFPFVLRIVRDRADAADVLQDVFWEAWRGAAAYDSARGTPEAWIITRARTRAIDRVRPVRRRGETFVAAPAGPPPPPGGDAVMRAEDRQLVAGALAQLSEAQREVIELAYYSGLTETEIAERLELPPGTVRTRIRLALARLRGGGDPPVSHEPFETLAALYAVGAPDGDDLAQFEAHLPSCAVCQAALREAEDALARAMLSTPPQAPPAEAREALVRRVGRARGADRRSWLTWAAATAVVAAAAAGFTGTWVAVRYEARLGQMARETAAVKERLARNEASLREQAALYRGAVELLRDPATRVVDLRAQGPAPAASGRMIWNDVGGGHLFVAGLAPTPPGKTYALWTIVGGTPRPAGLFDVDAAGRGTLRIAPASTGAAARVFVVTVEPEGGVPAPTGPIVLASK